MGGSTVYVRKIFSMLTVLTIQSLTDVSLSDQRVLATKCCQADEQFDINLRKCDKKPKIPSNSTCEDSVTCEQVRNAADLEWLPGHLQQGKSAAVRFGHLPRCDSRLALHLVDPPPDRARVDPNGSLVLVSPTARGAVAHKLFHSEEFCMDTADNDGEARRVFLLCPCDSLQCVSKCCPFGYAKTCEGLRCECTKHAVEWTPFHNENKHSSADDVAYEILEANEPPCPIGSQLWFDNPIYRPRHVLRHWWQYPNGHLFKKNLDKCGEIVIHNNSQLSYTTIGYCYLSLPFDGFFELGSMLHIPAAALLALTVATLATVPDNRVSAYGWVHNRAMQCHAASLLVSNSILATYLLSQDETTFCLTTPIAMYFSLVSASFWLNAICVNMTFGFRSQKGLPMIDRKSGRRMFLNYSFYAWGSSVIMTAFTASMWYAQDVPSGWVRPTLMETRRCFWEDEDGAVKLATFAYFYGPVCTLLLSNATLFGFIACRVRTLRRRSSILQRKASGSGSNFQYHRSALLYVKLLWLMGVAEMAVEISAWAAHSGGFYYLMAADVIDLLRAVSIFALCVCKRRTLRAHATRLERRARRDGACRAVPGSTPRGPRARLVRHPDQRLPVHRARRLAENAVNTVASESARLLRCQKQMLGRQLESWAPL